MKNFPVDNYECWLVDGHALARCDATTGHSYSAVAFCDTEARAKYLFNMIKASHALAFAAEKVLAGLNARIDAAGKSAAVPVFYGIAELHSAIEQSKQARAGAS